MSHHKQGFCRLFTPFHMNQKISFPIWSTPLIWLLVPWPLILLFFFIFLIIFPGEHLPSSECQLTEHISKVVLQ